MLVLLLSLIVLTIQLRLEIWDAPVRIIVFVWWPVCIYTGWIIVATVANISAFLVSINWNGGFLSPQIWTIILIAVATAIYLFLISTRNMREAAMTGVWALIAIAVKQWQENQSIVIAAIVAAAILFFAVSVHGYKNRNTSPFKKNTRGEFDAYCSFEIPFGKLAEQLLLFNTNHLSESRFQFNFMYVRQSCMFIP